MKSIYFIGMFLGTAAVLCAQGFDQSHAVLGRVLTTYTDAGRVDYRALKEKPQALKQYLAEAGAVSEAEFMAWDKQEQLAFLINLYNAATLQLVIDHYPVESIKKIGSFFKGPWDQPVVPLFGQTITLDELEHDVIRKRFKEPRIHMALVCAARGCPPLRGEAYTGDRLDQQLDDQSRRYLASAAGLVINKAKGEARISSIFKWYGDDFPSVEQFAEKYSGKSIQGLKIRYLAYDWSLNGEAE